MRPPFSSLGNLLGSVAGPCPYPDFFAGWKKPVRKGRNIWLDRAALPNSHDSGGSEKRDDKLARLEAVFFLSQQPLSSRKLAQLAGLADGTKARTLVRTLNRRYDADGSAFRVEEVAGGFLLMTRAKFAPWLRRLHSAPMEIRLSAPAMETLAVVAYRQPVLRAEIEAIRGVQSGEVLRQLIERGLVRIAGRSEELGRPFLYGTTKQFLQVFGLRHLEELPRAEDFRVPKPLEISDPTTSDSDIQPIDLSQHSPEAEEETNVKRLINVQPRQNTFAEDSCATMIRPGRDIGLVEDDDHRCRAAADEDDLDDDFEDDDEDDDDDGEDEDDDFDDEPWEEVDDEDFDDEDEDWDDDEDFDDDEDEDWDDDEDDDWDDDDEEEEEEGK